MAARDRHGNNDCGRDERSAVARVGSARCLSERKGAPILGVYTGSAGSDIVKGNKAIRWAEVTSDRPSGAV
jgi:hypothetical protein